GYGSSEHPAQRPRGPDGPAKGRRAGGWNALGQSSASFPWRLAVGAISLRRTCSRSPLNEGRKYWSGRRMVLRVFHPPAEMWVKLLTRALKSKPRGVFWYTPMYGP